MVGAYVTKCKRRTGHWWFQGFKARHPNQTVRMPQPLSYARAFNSTKEVVNSQHPCLEVGRNQQRLACSVQSSRNCMSNAIARGMMLQMRSMSPGCESCTLVMQTVEFVQAIHLLVNRVPLKLRLALSPISFKRCWFCNWKKEETLNSKGVCITDSEVLDELKAKEEEKMEKQRMKCERKEQKKLSH